MNGCSPAWIFQQIGLGTVVYVQYDSQAFTRGIFQGFQNGTVLLSNFNGFTGLARLNIHRINAVVVG